MIDKQSEDHQNRKSSLVMWIFLGIIAYFLLTEHWAHIVPYLPWLFLFACPLLHIFMHGHHGSHDDHPQRKDE